MICQHDVFEQDTAAHADGLCPICLASRVSEMDAALAQAWGALSWIMNYDSEDKCLARARDEIERVRKNAGTFDYDAMRAEVEKQRPALIASHQDRRAE